MNRSTYIVLAFLLGLGSAQPAVAADEGQIAFNNHCRTCHTTKEGDNRLGPSLHKILGRKAGSSSGYGAYSEGMRSSGITWDEATLDKLIANPEHARWRGLVAAAEAERAAEQARLNVAQAQAMVAHAHAMKAWDFERTSPAGQVRRDRRRAACTRMLLGGVCAPAGMFVGIAVALPFS